MDTELRANIKKSAKAVAEEKPEVFEYLLDVEEEEGFSSAPLSSLKGHRRLFAMSTPWFCRDRDSELRCPLDSIFGIYLIAAAIRGILVGLRFMQAGDLLHENRYLAAALNLYYTASFQLLRSFLALNGRVLINRVMGPLRIVKRKDSRGLTYDSLEPTPEVIIAILTRNNVWKFEPRGRSHSAMWKELKQVFGRHNYEIPDYFYHFFEYICSYGPDSLPYDKHVEVGIERLVETRHEAIYEGFAFDDYAWEQKFNLDNPSIGGSDLKSKAYGKLAVGLLTYCVGEFMELKDSIPEDHLEKIRPLVGFGILMRPFELGFPTSDDRSELNEALLWIITWLFDTGGSTQK